MARIALFPGSFDPFTIGHESIVRRSLDLFDRVIVAVGKNSTKANLFSLEQRVSWIESVFLDTDQVSVASYEGLTVDFCQKMNAGFILRGLRTSADFGFERGIGQVNKALLPSVETIFVLALPEHSAISSTIIRDIIRNGGDATQFVPKVIRFS
ncbi:MAG: pantetheine-phosphate adenylyltransferase [Bacteroidia bacterium]